MRSIYEVAGGREGILKLAAAWHARVMEDDIVSHAFSHGFHPQHTERLAAYWVEALGGPPDYSERYGDESSVVRIHSGNGIHTEMDQRAIVCVSIRRCRTSALLRRIRSERCCTITLPGPLPRPLPNIIAPQMTFLMEW